MSLVMHSAANEALRTICAHYWQKLLSTST